jgi:hypothetical protein
MAIFINKFEEIKNVVRCIHFFKDSLIVDRYKALQLTYTHYEYMLRLTFNKNRDFYRVISYRLSIISSNIVKYEKKNKIVIEIENKKICTTDAERAQQLKKLENFNPVLTENKKERAKIKQQNKTSKQLKIV